MNVSRPRLARLSESSQVAYVEYVNDINGLVSHCAPFAGSGAASAPVYACKIMRFFYQGVSYVEPSHCTGRQQVTGLGRARLLNWYATRDRL